MDNQSLRKISEYFQKFLGITVSHQTIKNWSNKNHTEKIENKKFDYSGYYLYDEQFLRLNGTRHYKLTLYDSILNIPVAEKIVRRRIPENTKKFIKESTNAKPFVCLTTDFQCMGMFRWIGSKTSICTFNLFKTINHKIKTYYRKNKLNKKEKQAIYDNAQKLKN